MPFALAARTAEGLLMIAVLGGQYLAASALAYVLPGAARFWRERIHRLGGPWFASCCRRHGALLLKVGQVVGSRPDILPLAWVDACAELRDQAPARSHAQVLAVLSQAYEGRIDEHLRDIEPQPIASASFGQVHRARLPDGRMVAVKVQHGDLGPRVAIDLALLGLALRLVRLAAPSWPVGLVNEEITRTSREEQDYLHEALAADRLRGVLARSGIRVPQVHLEHTRERVLVTEFAPGETLARTDLASLPRERREALAQRIAGAWVDMLLEEGLFHADPHGGNFILDGDDLWVIDFGMTAAIGPRERHIYARFLSRLSRGDTDGMVDALVELGVLLPGADLDAIRALAREIYVSLGSLNPRSFKGSRRERELSQKATGFLRRARGLAFPRHTILLARALGLIEGVCGELDPARNILDIVRPRLVRMSSLRGRLDDWLETARTRLQRWIELPERLDQLLARPAALDTTPLLAGMALIAALLLPEGAWRLTAACAAGLALAAALLRRRG